MPLPLSHLLAARHARVRTRLDALSLDALVVTAASNIRYLTNHTGTAGVLVVTPAAVHLLVDFRYRESVRAAQESPAACPGLRAWDVPASYDEALLACLAEIGVSTVGFEAAHVTVARHEYWRAAVESRRIDVTFRPTNRVVEEARLIKDASEVATLRDAAARLGPVGAYTVHVEADGAPRASLVFASTVYTSPARIPAESLHVFGIESEFGFSFGRDLPPRPGGYSENEVLDAVKAVHAAIEIVDSRFTDWKRVSAAPKLADNGGNAGIVIGPACADWRGMDFARNAVCLFLEGKAAVRAAGAKGGVEPLRGLAWLASTYAPRFGGIRRGQVIMTGSCTGITLAHPGASVVADFGSLGQASVVFET